MAAAIVPKTVGSEHKSESGAVDSSDKREESGVLKDSRVRHDALQGARIAATPVGDRQRSGDADAQAEPNSALGATQKPWTRAVDPAGGSANSQASAFRTAVHSSFGSSAGSASSSLRSPQSSFEGQNLTSGGCSSIGAGAGPLIAMYHPGALPPRPQPAAQAAASMPALQQAPAIAARVPTGNQPAAAAAAAAGSGGAPEDWRPGVPVPRGEYPGSPILPTDGGRCDAIFKCVAPATAMVRG